MSPVCSSTPHTISWVPSDRDQHHPVLLEGGFREPWTTSQSNFYILLHFTFEQVKKRGREWFNERRKEGWEEGRMDQKREGVDAMKGDK